MSRKPAAGFTVPQLVGHTWPTLGSLVLIQPSVVQFSLNGENLSPILVLLPIMCQPANSVSRTKIRPKNPPLASTGGRCGTGLQDQKAYSRELTILPK